MSKERPELPGIIKPRTTEIEGFQNKTIRPIIKMQHALLIAFITNYFEKRKIVYPSLSEEKKKLKIKSILEKDIQFRNMVLGSIIGHFSMDEYVYYIISASEMNKRIIQITIQRFQDSL
ncbi:MULTISPECIES: glyoxalase [unclassified Polaribacter]|uniref:glyoxalase n=1 Tax=unclassified Polaribacter TaxID=196858 RepID=UPI0011BED059|nr:MULTISPECIES: glyoxalase [unclassified Polaribacter]TXD53031.1 glyoxalase [Polaribacter sp. IC063]TXD59468.1 glyoxalase [Polaribacter sp. IC066]